MNNEHDDDNQPLHVLYQSIPKEEPPPELDVRIMQAAHQAIKVSIPRVVNLHRKPSNKLWIKPLSYAAVMVLCLGVVLRIQMDLPEIVQSHSDIFNPPSESAESPADYPVQELQQSDRDAPVRSLAPAAEMMSAKPAPVLELSKQVVRPSSPAPTALSEQKIAESKTEMDNMPSEAPVMPDAASYAAPPAAVAERLEKSKMIRKSERPDTTVADMMRLYHADETQPLLTQLQAFITKYPDYVLPTELQKIVDTKLNPAAHQP